MKIIGIQINIVIGKKVYKIMSRNRMINRISILYF